MPRSASSISSNINDLMRMNGNEGITLKWEQFYELCDRSRIAPVVMENIATQLKKNDLHIVYANNNVIIVRDFCWNPVEL